MKSWFITLLSASLLLTTSSCSLLNKSFRSSTTGPNVANLTQEEAKTRAERISEVDYTLSFRLDNDSDFYTGMAIIEFDRIDTREDLELDFDKGEILSLSVNGSQTEPIYDRLSLNLPGKLLKAGRNKVTIHFKQSFSRDGHGLVRFVDPEDQRVYTYTNLEPFNANRVFPSFDQPDLKATYTMTVNVPEDWEVLTSVRESEITKNKDQTKTWHFPQSARFSTYVFSLHAGPYTKWEASDNDKHRIPLRLFARQSLAPHVKVDDWFEVTRQGLDFFEPYFDYPYPYKKYDQILVPEFPAGAMENVGAVTFTERLVSRGQPSEKNRRSLTNVILHEMAHMWFGNLVTMKWWNDLWLNESFATYMAHVAMSDNTRFKDQAWRSFNGTKSWAYWEDQLVTTHPIEATVNDTLSAFANFDGITYGKGASVLKQISYYLGPEKFKKGVQLYFKEHAGENAELKDFMASLSQTSKKDLGQWQKLWLQTAGLNTVHVDLTCQKGKIKELKLRQTAPEEHPTIRPHAFKVAFFDTKDSQLIASKVIKVYLSKPETLIAEVKGSQCPQLVHPNFEDHGYFKASLDKNSVNTLKSDIDKIKNPFVREMLWSSLWEMVRDAEISLSEYASMLIEKGLTHETDTDIVRQLIDNLQGKHSSLLYYYSKAPNLKDEPYDKLVQDVERLMWSRLVESTPQTELQRIWFESYIQLAESETAQNNLVSLLSEKTKFKGLEIDQDHRWKMALKLKERNHEQAEKWLKVQAKQDNSSSAENYKIAAQALTPDWDAKARWIEEYKKKNSDYSQAQFRWALNHLFPPKQESFREKYADDFYADLIRVHETKEAMSAPQFMSLAPNLCHPGQVQRVTEFLSQNKDLTAPLLKRIKVMRQEGQRCLKVTAEAASVN